MTVRGKRRSARSSGATRSLQVRVPVLQLLGVISAEALLLAAYRSHDAVTHWGLHFLAALTAWSVASSLWLTLKGLPPRAPLLVLLGWHLFAIVPAFLFVAAAVPHREWMNVFLGHLVVDRLPGAHFVGLSGAFATTALYLLLLWKWYSARRAEVAAGMSPGIGLGGTHLVRPQIPPDRTLLPHTHYGGRHPPQVVLLHGLAASYALWQPVAERLAELGPAVVVPDLLGFGRSRRIGTTFSLDAQVAAVSRLLDHTGAISPVIVGHSFGCAVAASLAGVRSEAISQLVLVSPPVFRDGLQARERLSERGWLARQVVRGTPVASSLCNVMCLTRGAAARLAPRLAPNVPALVAREAAEHTWPAYRDALNSLLQSNPVPDAIASPSLPTTIIVGDADRETPAEDVLNWPHGRVEVEVWDSDHLLPLRHPQRLAEFIAAKVSAAR